MKAKNLTTRRRFFWKAGAALSAPLAVTAARAAADDADDVTALKERLRQLEDLNAIRELNRSYAKLLNARAHAEMANLFNEREHVAAAPAILRVVSEDQLDELAHIELAADRRTAAARIPCTVRIGKPMESACSLIEMALQQGGGVTEHAERGVLEGAYVKRGGIWKIERLGFRAEPSSA